MPTYILNIPSQLPSLTGNSLLYLRVNAGENDIEWAATAGGGITIGTTAIASGTVNRILFEGSGNVVQQDSTFVWNNTDKRLILGTEASADANTRLVITGSGTSTTTFGLKVHNSTGTNNAFAVRNDGFVGIGFSSPISTEKFRINGATRVEGGSFLQETATNNRVILSNGTIDQRRDVNGMVLNSFTNVSGGTNAGFGWRMSYGFGGTDFTHIITTQTSYTNAEYGGEGQNFVLWNRAQNNTGTPRMKFVITRFNQGTLDGQSSSFDFSFGIGASIGSPTPALRITSRNNLIIGGTTANGTATRTIAHYNGTPPNADLTDAYQQYSADITAGNAAPHFRTESGDIVKIYRVGGWGLPTGIFTRTTFDTATVTTEQLAERVAALIQDLRDNHQLLKT